MIIHLNGRLLVLAAQIMTLVDSSQKHAQYFGLRDRPILTGEILMLAVSLSTLRLLNFFHFVSVQLMIQNSIAVFPSWIELH